MKGLLTRNLPTVLAVLSSLSILKPSNALIIEDGSKESVRMLLEEHKAVLAAFTTSSLPSLEAFNSNFRAASEARLKTAFLMVNCNSETELCREYDVYGYPTVRLINENGTTRYRGKKTASALISFAKKSELPTITEIQPSDLQAFKTTDDIVIIGYLPPEWSDLRETFQVVAAKHHRRYVFGLSGDIRSAQAEGISVPSIACYKNTDGDNRVASGALTESDIEKFLELATKPIINEVTERSIDFYMNIPNKLTAFIFASSSPSHRTKILHQLTPTAKKFEQYVKFGILDATEFSPMVSQFGLSPDGVFPALVLSAAMKNQVFLFKQGKVISDRAVEEMLMAVLKGKVRSGEVWGEEEMDVNVYDEEEEGRSWEKDEL